jgi:ribosome maturation protein SDO1
MVTVDHAVIARLTSHGQHFEILVDCDAALAVREGKEIDMKDVLAAEKIFSDSKKGNVAAEGAMKQVFETADVHEVAKKIIQKGEIQLTQEYRNNLREKKRRQIINMIHRNGVDPKTHAPHPAARIEAALEEAKFHVEEFHPVEQQVQEALKKIKVILPIRFEMKELEVKISPNYAGKAYATVRNFGVFLREEWTSHGYFVAHIEIPGGLEQEFYDKINAICHGDVEVKVIRTR